MVDDGSQDDTKSMVESFMNIHSNISYVRQDHQGYSAAINLGCKMAHGEFIAFQDDDDISVPNRFELQIKELLNDEKVELVYGLTRWVDKNGKEVGYFPEMLRKQDFRGSRAQGFTANLWNGCKIPCTSIMMRKRHFPSDGKIFETQFLEKSQDWLHDLEVAYCYPIVGLSTVLVEVLRDSSCPSMMSGKEAILKNYKKVLKLAEQRLSPKMKRLERWDHFRRAWGYQYLLESKVIGGWKGIGSLLKNLCFCPFDKRGWIQFAVFGKGVGRRFKKIFKKSREFSL